MGLSGPLWEDFVGFWWVLGTKGWETGDFCNKIMDELGDFSEILWDVHKTWSIYGANHGSIFEIRKKNGPSKKETGK